MQTYPTHEDPPIWAACIPLIIVIPVFLYIALCIFRIAKKGGASSPWMAWIPVLNILPMLEVAGKPTWWILLFFVPIANIVVSVLMWMGVAEALGKPNWVGVLIVVPCVGILVPGYLAFSESGSARPPAV